MPIGQALLDQMAHVEILPNSLAIWGIGQMGIAVKGPDGLLYIDPFLTGTQDTAEWWHRAYAPPLLPADLANATAILSTHEHDDHFNVDTIQPAVEANPAMRVVATGWCMDQIDAMGLARDRVIVPRTEETFRLPQTSARITALPSAHYDVEHDAEKGHRWLGYLINWNGVTLYHSGDTIIYDGYVEMLQRHPQADLAMLPVNGRDWYRETDANATGNLLPREAARLARDMGWTLTIAGHNDLFPNNALPFGELAQAFEDIAPRVAYKFLQPGELLYFVK